MIYRWCKHCASRVCLSEDSHRAQKFHHFRADFALGASGKRIRKLFDKKELAKDFEYKTKSEYRNSGIIPKKFKITFGELADKYYNDHCLVMNRYPKGTTYHMIVWAKKAIGDVIASSVPKSRIREIRTDLCTKVSPSTANRYISVIKAIYNKGIEWDLIDSNPCEKIGKAVEDALTPKFLSLPEIELLYKSFDTFDSKVKTRLEDYANVIAHTGARPISIKECSFDNGDVEMTTRTIWFTTYKGKGNKHRYPVPIDDTLFEILLRRVAATGGKGLVFDTKNIEDLTADAVKRSGINEGRPEKLNFTIYGLKHCFVSHLLMSGASLFDVAKLLGHTDTKMIIKHYGNLTQEHLRAVQSRINLTPIMRRTPLSAENIISNLKIQK